MCTHRSLSFAVRAALALPLAALAFSPTIHAQDVNLSGAWKTTVQVTTEGAQVKKFGATVYVSQSGDVLTGEFVRAMGKCGLYFAPLAGFSSPTGFHLSLMAQEVSDECYVMCNSPVEAHLQLVDGVHAHGEGKITSCLANQGSDPNQYFDLQMSKLSGMQRPDDPDGDGPGVPISQIGAGEPGSGGAHDFAITALTAPKKVTLSAKKPEVTGKVKVRIQNRGQHTEVIDSFSTLQGVVRLEVEALSIEPPPGVLNAGLSPSLKVQMLEPKAFPILLAPRKQLALTFLVTFDHAIDPAASTKADKHADFRFLASVHHDAMPDRQYDNHKQDDWAPRRVMPPYEFDTYPDGKIKDKGVGAKLPDGTLGGDVLTDVVMKPN